MYWWAWIAVGAILLGSELGLHRRSVLPGVCRSRRLRRGMLQLGVGMPIWLQWLLFAVLAATLHAHLPAADLRKNTTQPAGDEGRSGGRNRHVATELPPGETCRVEYRGCSWSAVNAGLEVILPPDRERASSASTD